MIARIGWCVRSSTPSTAGDERSFISLGKVGVRRESRRPIKPEEFRVGFIETLVVGHVSQIRVNVNNVFQSRTDFVKISRILANTARVCLRISTMTQAKHGQRMV